MLVNSGGRGPGAEGRASGPGTGLRGSDGWVWTQHLLGTAQRPTAVHVVLGVDNEHHLVCAQAEAAVHIASALHAHEPLPRALGLTPQGTHLLALPAPEFLQVPAGTGPRGGDLQAPEVQAIVTTQHA